RKILDPFLDALEREAMAVRMGDPRDPDTYLGPLTRRRQLEVLAEQVEDALARGARLLTGGKRSEEWDGWWEPTVLSNCNHEMLVMHEESFGPIVGIMAVDDDDEAVHLMNDTRYGLTAGVYTKDE